METIGKKRKEKKEEDDCTEPEENSRRGRSESGIDVDNGVKQSLGNGVDNRSGPREIRMFISPFSSVRGL